MEEKGDDLGEGASKGNTFGLPRLGWLVGASCGGCWPAATGYGQHSAAPAGEPGDSDSDRREQGMGYRNMQVSMEIRPMRSLVLFSSLPKIFHPSHLHA